MNRHGFAPLAILLVIAGILAIGAGGYFYWHQASDKQADFDFEVLYTANGFVPDLLDVPVGSRVAFKNSADVSLWVASDPHPAHTDYPEFDAKREYAPGETYIFQFTRTGTFSYHNHERPSDRGIVHVVDSGNSLPDTDKTKAGQREIRDKLVGMLDPHDPNSIFKVVDAIQADPALAINCHDIAHDVGHRAYELFGFSEAMTFNNPNHLKHALVQYICAGGYMHGIVEELSLHQPEFKTKPDPICAGVPDTDRESCYHGVGHAFMFANHRAVASSLADCRETEKLSDTYRCFEGVWMEFFWGETPQSSALGWDVDKPLAPCIAAKEDEKPTCLLYSTFGYLRTHVKDYDGAVAMCTTSGLKDSDVEFCLKGLGITMMSKFKGQHLEGSEVYVDGLSTEKKRAFYEGVMGYAYLSSLRKSELEHSCNLFKNDTDICLTVVRDIQ